MNKLVIIISLIRHHIFNIAILPVLFLSFTKVKAKAIQTAGSIHSNVVIVKPGISDDGISKDWRNALETRMTRERLDSISLLLKPMTDEEKAWIKLIVSKTTRWNSFKDSLEVPFADCHVPDTIYVLVGIFGVDDAFTYQYNTVCFDLTALQTNYGAAGLTENDERMDRLYAHEFTHLVHKQWARKNKLVLKTFKDSVLWECLYEGVGMYRSLSKKWMPQKGGLPKITIDALEELYPVFVDRLITIESSAGLSDNDKDKITANLSRGPVTKKWGAFTVAIWLAQEANGDEKKLAYCINHGIDSIILLAQKYLAGNNKARFKNTFTP